VHELAIAGEILKIVRSEVPPDNGARVTRIRLAIGGLTHVQEDCLRFAVSALTRDTSMAGVELEISPVTPLFQCRDCAREFEAADHFFTACPGCGAFGARAVRGEELDLVSIEVER
jgi:hydrogenase nickel incorporation protein HypA/HybF